MAEPTLLPERLQYRPTKIELDESIEKGNGIPMQTYLLT